MTATEFDLRAITREVLEEGGCDSFREYAVKVLGRIPQRELKNALMLCLPDFVREVDHRAKPPVLPTAGSHASPKVKGIANAWSAFISRHITTDLGAQIRLADATEGQVRFYVGLLRVKASQTEATADGFERVADLMAEQKVGRVKDLPAHLGRELVRSAA